MFVPAENRSKYVKAIETLDFNINHLEEELKVMKNEREWFVGLVNQIDNREDTVNN